MIRRPAPLPPGRWRVALLGACVIGGVGCVALAVAAVFAIAGGGYRPEQYAVQPDPVRVGLIMFLASGCVVFTLFGAHGFWSVRSQPIGSSWAAPILGLGFVVICGSLLALFVWAPPTAGSLVVPVALRVALFTGIGLVVVGAMPGVWSGLVAAVQRRDVGLLVALCLVVTAILIGFFRRAS